MSNKTTSINLKAQLLRYELLGTTALQILALILLICLTHFAQAVELAATTPQQQPSWLQLANSSEAEKLPLSGLHKHTLKAHKSWSIALDNDLLAPGHRDQDYTYGLNFTQTGASVRAAKVSLNSPLIALDRLLNIDSEGLGKTESFSRELGAFGFTPEDITQAAANPLDRPYASIIYLSSAREQTDLVTNVAWKTTLTLGVLGLGIVGELQNFAHRNTQGTTAQGWDNQISEGGELTGRYVIARQKIIAHNSDGVEVKSTWQASLGYITETSWSLNIRTGKLHGLWSSFNPELTSYGEKASYASSNIALNEHYFWAGISVKARAYNAFLQGQWGSSPVTYGRNDLNPLLFEAWAGYTFAFKQGFRLSYVLRGHSSEINTGAGDRNLVWGGLIIAKTI